MKPPYPFILKICNALLISFFFPQFSIAQFSTLTSETLVNTTTAGDQEGYWWSVRTVAVQPDGSYIIVWIDKGGQDGQAEGIFGQRFNSSGVKTGVEFQVNTTFSGQQYSPTIAVAPDGNFIVAWEGPGSSIDVWAQRFTSDGVKIGTEFLLNTTVSGNQRYPELQFYPDGTFVAGFVDGSQTVLQRFDAEGHRIGVETRISSGTGNIIMDGLCVRPDNSLLVVWTSNGDVYGQFFTSTLQPVGTQVRLNTHTTGTQQYAVGRVDGEGNFVVTWEDLTNDGSGMGSYYRRYDKNFNPLSVTELPVTSNISGDQFEPQVAIEPGGRFFIAWSDRNNRDGSNESIWFREFDNNGNPIGTETRINQSTVDYQAYPLIDINASGRFVIAWEGNGTQPGQVDNHGIYARAYQLSQTGTNSISVTPTTTAAGDIVTVTMTLSNPVTIANVKPNPLSVSGSNGVFATLLSGPSPASATVGTSPVTFTWTYRLTANEESGLLTFGGNARGNSGSIFPYALSNTISIKPSLFLSDITAPNLVNDANNHNGGPRVFTIGAKVTNPGLLPLADVTVYLGNGVTAGAFPVTTMYSYQTNNTYQGSFALYPLAGSIDCKRMLGNLGPAKTVVAGRVDFNGDGVINTLDDGLLSNGKVVIDGRIDINMNGSIATDDDKPLPPGVFNGYREPAIIDGYVDSNRDGIINILDSKTYGGETRNIYWQVAYDVTDATGQPTFGDCNDFVDDLRYNWVTWAAASDAGITRTDQVYDFASVRCELSAASNKMVPNVGFVTASTPIIISGSVDVNSDGKITDSDDGTYYGKNIIDGKIDMNNSGTITAADNGTFGAYPVIAGQVDLDKSGAINSSDSGIIVSAGDTFSITINNADFGTIGNGFDANRDGLWDLDFWYQPIGSVSWPASAFRLIDIQSDITGTGGSNPLNGITTHYDNEPYLTRLFDDRLNQGGTFTGSYTFTFQMLSSMNACISPYQEAASGTNNEKYNSDYNSCFLKIYSDTYVLPVELLHFNAAKKGKYADLNWETAQEINNNHFDIEHGKDGIDFKKIGEVSGAQDKTVLQKYSFRHYMPGSGLNYYRLKQVDDDGAAKYSDVKSVFFEDVSGITIFPNPSKSKIYIHHGNRNAILTVIVYSTGGKQLLCDENFISGSSIDMSVYSNNVYLVKIIESNGKVSFKKVIKQ